MGKNRTGIYSIRIIGESEMTKYFCVFGNPIHHSLSPLMHSYVFEKLQNKLPFYGFYGRYQLDDAKDLRKKFFDLKLDGANITLPFKKEAFDQCDEALGVAREIKMINTWVRRDNKICGYNTDADGFFETIKPYGYQTALVLGAGGSARAIAFILKQKGFDVEVLNRSSHSLKTLQNDFKCYTLQDFKLKAYDLIINATSASISNQLPFEKKFLEDIFSCSKMAYDLFYGRKTPFLDLAKQKNLQTKDGKEMLIAQGALAFLLFCRLEDKEFLSIVDLMKKVLM